MCHHLQTVVAKVVMLGERQRAVDMNRLESFPRRLSTSSRERPFRLSVIVPFAPHETEGELLLERLHAWLPDTEIVLVRANGCALPMEVSHCEDCTSVHVIASPPGRARQMNVGAQVARGQWLWFLHADSQIFARTSAALEAFIERSEAALGYFDLRYRDGPALMWLNALGANLRARWLGLPFGDQGFVLPASWFERLGGFDEDAVYGEDHLLVRRARAAGLPLRRVRAPLANSARRYVEHGWWRTTARHLALSVRQAWALRRDRHKARTT